MIQFNTKEWMQKKRKTLLYQHVEILPEVLGHESEEGEESPSKAVKAGVTIVGVPSSFHTCKALWTSTERNAHKFEICHLIHD